MSTISPTNGPTDIKNAEDLDKFKTDLKKKAKKGETIEGIFTHKDITYKIYANKPKGSSQNPTFEIKRIDEKKQEAQISNEKTFSKSKNILSKFINIKKANKQFKSELKKIDNFESKLDNIKSNPENKKELEDLKEEIKKEIEKEMQKAAKNSTQLSAFGETAQSYLNDTNNLELHSNKPMKEKLVILQELCARCNDNKLSEDVRNGAKKVLLGYGEQLGRDFLLALLKGNETPKELCGPLFNMQSNFPDEMKDFASQLLKYDIRKPETKKDVAQYLLNQDKKKPFLSLKDAKLLKSIADPQSNSPSVKNKKKSATQKTHQSKNEKKTKENQEIQKAFNKFNKGLIKPDEVKKKSN